MSATAEASDPLDSNTLQALLIRWKLAEQYLYENPDGLETGKMALHVVICRDMPMLIGEVLRLRPDLLNRSGESES